MGVVVAGSGEVTVWTDAAGAGPENKGFIVASFKGKGFSPQCLALEIAGGRLTF
ncbi:hypothetical protein SDC9_171606 [bioreactor metagenome]|uniref:Uncharacterized protein n=1 Tax=bioreactor metagenome TaxID=1076179 RepID=A0A645GDX6_9ZZZZ